LKQKIKANELFSQAKYERASELYQ